MHDDDIIERGHAHQRREITEQIVRGLAVHRGEDGVVVTEHADGIAVGRGLGDHVGTDDRAGTGTVFDHYRLFHRFPDRLTDDTHDSVVRGAGNIRHHGADRPLRIVLRKGSRRGDTGKQAGRGGSRSGFRESHTDLHQVFLCWERRLQLQPACDHIGIRRSNPANWQSKPVCRAIFIFALLHGWSFPISDCSDSTGLRIAPQQCPTDNPINLKNQGIETVRV